MNIVTKIGLLVLTFFSAQIWASTPVREYHLANGLTLVVKPDHRSPVVISEVWYKVGSSYEPLGLTGISHMLEHLMFKGTPKFPGNQLLLTISAHGGQLNALTTRDFTAYYEILSSNKLPLIFKLEADRMANLALADKSFDSEHQVVQQERELRVVNDPQSLLFERFNAAAFPNNPYQNPTSGWPDDLVNLTNQDAKNWYKSWYGPNNAVLVIVGDVTAKKVYQLAQKYFSDLPAVKLPVVKSHPNLKALGKREVTVRAPAKVPYELIGFNVPSAATTKDKSQAYALAVLANILAGSDSALLPKTLVRDKQIASSVDVSYDLYARLPGLLTIGVVPGQNRSFSSINQSIRDTITQLQNKPISADMLTRVKTQMIASHVYDQDSLTDTAYLLGSLSCIGLGWQEINNYPTQVNQVTAEQIQTVAKTFLTSQNMTIGQLIPIQQKNGKAS